MSHLHWGQEGCEGDDVACNTQKGATNQTFANVGKQPKAGISCDKLRRYISGLILPSFVSKDRLRLFFLSRRALCVMVHYDTSTLLPSSSCDITEKAYKLSSSLSVRIDDMLRKDLYAS